MRHKPGAGFSIVELVVALGVLSCALILVIGMFSQLLDASQKSVDVTSGLVLAESLLAQTVADTVYDPAARATFFQSPSPAGGVLQGGTYSLNKAQYFYKIYCEDVALDSQGLTLNSAATDSGSPAQTRLKRLDIALWWWDTTTGTSATTMQIGSPQAGMGRLEVSMTRFLWPDSDY